MPPHSPKDRNVPRKRFGTREAAARHASAAPRRGARPAEPREPRATERIAKVIARAGACSRRDAEAWIGEGRVAVNGTVLSDPAFNVGESDAITIDGTPLARRERTRLFRFHKPRGLVSTEHDPEGRPTIFDYLREHWSEGPRVVGVGRLDINTEGLILLTNDGGLARVLELPSTGWVRRYRVRVNGETDQATLDRLSHGITIDGVNYAGIEATLDRVQGANCWLTMSLREGKNREIKRVLEHLGLAVNRLIRTSFGPFQLGELPEGSVEEVRTKVLREQLGPSLAETAGADFTSPSGEDAAAAGAELVRHRPERVARQDRRPSDGPRPKPAARHSDGPRTPEVRAPAKAKPAPRVRKHVSVLRRQAAEAEGPRKRIERAETADRSGRMVVVERVVPVAPEPPKEKPQTRNGRRFEALRKERDDAGTRKVRGRGDTGPGQRPRVEQAGTRRAQDGSRRPARSQPRAIDKQGMEPSGRKGAPRQKDAGFRSGKGQGTDQHRHGPEQGRAAGGTRSKPPTGRPPARGAGHGKGGHAQRPTRDKR